MYIFMLFSQPFLSLIFDLSAEEMFKFCSIVAFGCQTRRESGKSDQSPSHPRKGSA